MSANNLLFAYSQENKKLVQSIDQELGAYLGSVTHIPAGRTTAAPSISEQVLNQPGRIILFISDNYLKSAQCMSNGLRLLQSRGADILPVIIPGEYTDEESGEIAQIDTSFDRVSDIIQYINYWQDRYLDLRRQKRQLQEEIDEEKFNEHLKKMREISSEVGEFLRLLRTTEYITYQEFIHNDYETLFRFVGDLNARDEFRKNRPTPESVTEEEAPADIEDIPGINLLNIAENVPDLEEEEVQPNLEMSEEEEDDDEAIIGDAADLYEQHPEEVHRLSVTEEESRTFDLEVSPSLQEYDKTEENEEETKEEEEEVELEENTEPEESEWAEELALESKINGGGFIEEEEEEEAIALNPEREIANANDLLENGNIPEGFSRFLGAIELHPTSANLRYHYAIALIRHQKDFDNATTQLNNAIQLDPQYETAYFLLGELSEVTEDFSEARKAYEALVLLNPDYPKAQFRLGLVLANHYEGMEKRALKALKNAIKQEPDNPDALYQYGVLQNEYSNKPQKAIKYFKATLDNVPDHPFAWYDIALLYHAQDQRKKAYKAYLKAIEINPELKTEENDQAFQILDKSKKKELKEIADSFRENNAIETLEENIRQLEALLKAKEEEIIKEKEEKEKEEEQKRGSGKTVFISGATAGIGRATAEVFARDGYRLIINGRRVERLEKMKQLFEAKYGIPVKIVAFDITNSKSVAEAINRLEDEWHPIDILINNAGKARGFAPVHEGELEHWEEMIDTNLKGLLYLTRAISPYMVARQSGHIINVCSSVGKEVYPNGNVYCATKHAVDALTKAMRLDLFKHNIKVSQVSPAHVEETEFALVRYDGDQDRAAKTYEGFKPLASSDVAGAIHYIASQAAHVNVQDILMMGTQQASSTIINRSARGSFEEE